MNGSGSWISDSGIVIEEPSVTILLVASADSADKLHEIAFDYANKFNQFCVLVTNITSGEANLVYAD